MALQLSIYPQTNLTGQYSYTSSAINYELVTDPTFFLSGFFGINSLASASSHLAMTASLGEPDSHWKAWYSSGTVAPTFSSYNGGTAHMIKLEAAVGASTGIYQKISGLQVGHNYDVKIYCDNTAVGSSVLFVGNMQATSWQTNGNWYYNLGQNLYATYGSNITGTITHTFTAQYTEEVVVIDYQPSEGTDLKIKKVSIKENATTAQANLTDVDDGQVLLDLMDANSIPITLSIDNFKNVGEKPQSYSKAFNLPSTKKNNRIFSSLYDVTRSVKSDSFAFNPHKQTRAVLKDNGFPVFEGYLKLLSIKENNGVPSYNVNLQSDSISLKAVLAKKTFADFDGGTYKGGIGFSELDHDYHKTNIKASWHGALPIANTGNYYTGFAGAANAATTDVLKYPFCMWSTDIYESPGPPNLPAVGSPVLNSISDAFRPWIKIKYLFDRIISEAGFSYSSDFLNTAHFKRLYMDFNWGKEVDVNPTTDGSPGFFVNGLSGGTTVATLIGTSYTALKLDSTHHTNQTAAVGLTNIGYNLSTHRFTSTVTTTTYSFDSEWNFDITSANVSFKCRVVHKDSGGNELADDEFTLTANNGTTKVWYYVGSWTLNTGDYLEFQAKRTSGSGVINQANSSFSGSLPHCFTSTNTNPQIDSSLMIKTRGKIKQWDFVKDIFTMFNLIAMQDRQNPNNLIIEPYKDVFLDDSISQYISINTLDWTDKVDMDSMEITPMKLKERVKFDYKKPKDYANKNYQAYTGMQFGSYEIDASDFDLASGEQKIALKVFSPTFLTPVFDDFNVIMTVPSILDGNIDNGTTGPIDNNPRILYDASNISTPLSSTSFTLETLTMDPDEFYIPPYNGLGSENQSRFGLVSHLEKHPAAFDSLDLNFGTHQIVGYGGSPPVHNLFNTYWQPYFDELYHPDTRVVKLNIALNAQDLSTFNFNDQIRIKNRLYRANKIDYKPEALSKVELILLP
tara:strand:+ start:2074 stop:4962 length:2889 start_codon:yes stop_codon:yes gene_type:complete